MYFIGVVMEHDKVLERLAYVVESAIGKIPYDKDIAKELGLSPANYSNMKKKKKLPLEAIIGYCALKRVSINWLLYEQSSEMLADSSGEVLKIPFLSNVVASAGGGAFNDDERTTYLSLDPAYVRLLGITENDTIDAITVTGESMYPTLKEGSIILIDKKKTKVTEGGIFVVNAGGNLFIKRLSITPKGELNMISDNPTIPVQTVSLDETFVIGKVIGALEKI